MNAATETEWFQCLSSFPICFVKGRIRFLTSHSRTSNATIGSAFVYLGANGELFTQVFSQFGQIRYTIAPHKILYPGQLWETLPLPKKQQVLNYIVHLYTDYPASQDKGVDPCDVYVGTNLEFEEIYEELAHLEEDGDVELIREMNTWTKEVMISQIHLVHSRDLHTLANQSNS